MRVGVCCNAPLLFFVVPVETGIYLFPVRPVIIAGSMNRTPTLTGRDVRPTSLLL